MTIFRPSAQMFVYLRVEELGDVGAFEQLVGSHNTSQAMVDRAFANVPQLPTAAQLEDPNTSLTQIAESLQELQSQADGLSQADYQRARRNLEAQREMILQMASSSDRQPRPWALLGSFRDTRFGRFGIQPLSVTIERNGFRTADTAKITLDWKTLPFDPRIVRSAAVEIVLGVVSEDDFADGVEGRRKSQRSGLPTSIIEQNPMAPLTGSTTRFVGWVDDWSIAHDESADTIDLECRDWTSMFLDTPLADDAVINLDLPIDQGIVEMLSKYTQLAGFPVVYEAVPGRPAAPAPSLGRNIPPVSRTRRGRNARTGRTGDQKMNLWDHITDTCVQLGLVPVVRDYELAIVNPVTQYRTTNTRRMIYGRNLKRLELGRKLGGVKVPTIEVRAYDPSIGRMRFARWPVPQGASSSGVLGVDVPPRPLRANEISPSGARAEERIQTYVLAPTTNPSQLTTAARSLFEQIGRQEVEGSFETRDVSSWDMEANKPFDPSIADLLHMDSGEAVEILIAANQPTRPTDVPTSPGGWVAMERAARASYLARLGMTRQVAEQIAALQDAVASMLWRVATVRIEFDSQEGMSIKCEFANFIEVRESASTSTENQAAELATPTEAIDRASDPNVRRELLRTSQARMSRTIEAGTAQVSPTVPVPGTAGSSGSEALDRLIQDEAALTSLARER